MLGWKCLLSVGMVHAAGQADNGLVASRYFWFGLPIVEFRFGGNGLTLGDSLGQFGFIWGIVQVSLD